MGLLWLVILFLLLSLSGFLLQWLLEGKKGALDPERMALSPLLGTALTGAVLIICLVLFDAFLLLLLFAVPALLLVVCVFRRARSTDPAGKAPSTDPAGIERVIDKADAGFLIFVVAFILLMLFVTFRDGAQADYLSIWGFKALVLKENESLRIPSFLEPLAYHHHQDYPLLFPALQAVLYRLSGDVLDRTAKLLYPLLLASAALYLYFHLKKRAGLAPALTGSLLLLASPALCGVHPGVCSAYMDVPLGCFTLAAFLSAMDGIREGRRADAFRAGLLLTAMVLTKNEGMAAAATALVILLAAGLLIFRKLGVGGFASLLLPVVLVGGVWFVIRLRLPAGNSDYIALLMRGALLDRISDLPAVAGRFCLEFIHFERWGFLWILALVCAPLWARKEWFLAFVYLAVMTLILIAAVSVSPLGVEYQTASAVPRLVSQLAPLAAACVGMGLKKRG